MNDFSPSQALTDHVKAAEGFVPVPRPDAAGYLTWGYGHKHRPGEAVPAEVTPAQADDTLAADLTIAGQGVRGLVLVEMTQDQFDGLADFAFNLGVDALSSSTLLRMFNIGDVQGAAEQCLQWDHAHVAGQFVVLAGLATRRQWDAARICPPQAMAASVEPPTLTEVVPDPNLQDAIETPSVP